jgi:hypothetical protein
MTKLSALVLVTVFAACGDDAATDAGGTPGRDSGRRDGGGPGTDAGGRDADASGTDSGANDAGTSAGDCSGRLLCDDFESYAAGGEPGGPWAVSVNMGAVAVDETRASSGMRSVRFTTDGGGGTYRRAYMEVEGDPVFPAAGEVLWGRMMVWLDAVPDGSVHWTHIEGEGDVPGMDFRSIYRYGGQHDGRLMANYETRGVRSDCWQHSDTTFPVRTWSCMEWRYDHANDRMEFWLDGTQLDDLTVMGRGEGCISHDTGDNWYAPVFDTLRLGWEHYQATSPKELYIDDVALDDERIGCPPP